jgi:hypothetical protein
VIPAVLAVGILLAMLAASNKARAASSSSAAVATAPPSTAPAVKAIVESGDPHKMVAAASAAQQAGQPQLAAELVKQARNAAVTGPKAIYPSPWPDVDPAKWTLFVRAMRGSNQKEITPGYSLGLFGFGMRRLVDLGLASNPHKMDHGGKQVWDADWIPALQPGPEKFLDDAELQYKTFVKSMNLYASQIKAELPEAIGALLDGKPVTMSGLLALAHRAGWAGMKAWSTDPKVRAEHKQSTAVFNKLNGVF